MDGPFLVSVFLSAWSSRLLELKWHKHHSTTVIFDRHFRHGSHFANCATSYIILYRPLETIRGQFMEGISAIKSPYTFLIVA